MTDIELEKLKRYLADALPTVAESLQQVAGKYEQVWCIAMWLQAAVLAVHPEFVESFGEFTEKFAAEYEAAITAFDAVNPNYRAEIGDAVLLLVPPGPTKTEVTTIH